MGFEHYKGITSDLEFRKKVELATLRTLFQIRSHYLIFHLAERPGRSANPRKRLNKWQRKGKVVGLCMLLTDREGRRKLHRTLAELDRIEKRRAKKKAAS